MIRCRCGNDEWNPVYDYVPYGMTVVRMECGAVCTNCGIDYDYATEWCEDCHNPEDECECERCPECDCKLDDCECEGVEIQ